MTTSYQVLQGDKLYELALRHGVTEQEIREENANRGRIVNWDKLEPGIQIWIPDQERRDVNSTTAIVLRIGLSEYKLLDITPQEAEIAIRSTITREVTAHLWRRQIDGATEHGGPMQPGDAVPDALVEALAEALDLSQYLTKHLLERGKR